MIGVAVRPTKSSIWQTWENYMRVTNTKSTRFFKIIYSFYIIPMNTLHNAYWYKFGEELIFLFIK